MEILSFLSVLYKKPFRHIRRRNGFRSPIDGIVYFLLFSLRLSSTARRILAWDKVSRSDASRVSWHTQRREDELHAMRQRAWSTLTYDRGCGSARGSICLLPYLSSASNPMVTSSGSIFTFTFLPDLWSELETTQRTQEGLQ